MSKWLLYLLSPILLYLLVAYVSCLFPVGDDKDANATKEIYLYHDKHLFSHSEIILSLKDLNQSYKKAFVDLLGDMPRGYIAFSYGDRDFMMDKGGFDELNISLGLKGLFLKTPALLKVGHYSAFKKDKCQLLRVDKARLEKVQAEIFKSFRLEKHTPLRYPDVYGEYYRHYYEAKHPYHLFYTCNTWSGEVLRKAGIKMPLWTPFAECLVSE